jgi:hypothetical protein
VIVRDTPTCFTGWKQVTDDCPLCGPYGPCTALDSEGDAPSPKPIPSFRLRLRRWMGVA